MGLALDMLTFLCGGAVLLGQMYGGSAMASESRNPFEHGPFVQIAAFCERVLREADGVLSLIRVIDVVTHREGGADAPRDMPPFRFPLMLVLTLKAGRSRGRHEVTIVPELPSGETLPSTTATVQMEGEGRGVNFTSRIDMEFTIEGLHWFQIWFNDQILTRLPLQVRYSRLATGSAGLPPQPESS